MLPLQIKILVHGILTDIAQDKIEELVARMAVSRLSADQIRCVLQDYPCTPILPPDNIDLELDVVKINGVPCQAWSVHVPIWTVEEGRSDLTLELTIKLDLVGISVELDDLHVK